jgi:hypothetical protein
MEPLIKAGSLKGTAFRPSVSAARRNAALRAAEKLDVEGAQVYGLPKNSTSKGFEGAQL